MWLYSISLSYDIYLLIFFIGTEPLFFVLHFMEITSLLGPGIKVLKVGHAITSSFHYHVTVLLQHQIWYVGDLSIFLDV